MHPERNDVNINRLFSWGREVKIVDRYGNEITTAHLRLVGDIDVNKARVVGLRRSAELRKVLKTPDSDERVVFIEAPKETLTREDLVEYTASFKIREFSLQGAKAVDIPMPKEPKSDSTLEEQERFQKDVDEYDEKRSKAITSFVMERLAEERVRLSALDDTTLYRLFEQETINDLCERKMLVAYKEYCAYAGTYNDPEYKYRMFSSFDVFENLPSDIKEQYLNAYETLEINIEDLKKSLEATQ